MTEPPSFHAIIYTPLLTVARFSDSFLFVLPHLHLPSFLPHLYTFQTPLTPISTSTSSTSLSRCAHSLIFAFANALLQAQFTHPCRAGYPTTTTDIFRTRSAPAVFLSLFARLAPLPRFPVEFLACLGSQCGCDAELQGLLEALIAASAAAQPTALAARSEVGGFSNMHHNVAASGSSSVTELMMLRTASMALFDRTGDADLLRGGLRAR